MSNLPVPYDPEFAAWQQPVLIFTPSHEAPWKAMAFTEEPIRGRFTEEPIRGRWLYYDKAGAPITLEQWGQLREIGCGPEGFRAESYVRIGEDTVGEARVSTVWLGIDHGMYLGEEDYKPVIFETMIFGGRYDDMMRRYHTEWEAIEGHAEAVADLQMGMRPWWAHGGCEDDEWHMERGDA